MPFNIELSEIIDDTIIKLQVVDNTITIYFSNPNPSRAALIRQSFAGGVNPQLTEHFDCSMVRGSDTPHVKRHHGHMGETQTMHLHTSLNSDIEVNDLRIYLDAILRAQQTNTINPLAILLSLFSDNRESLLTALSMPKFLTRDEADEICAAFAVYLKEYSGSKLQKQVQSERQLTKDERLEIADIAQQRIAKGIPICAKDAEIARSIEIEQNLKINSDTHYTSAPVRSSSRSDTRPSDAKLIQTFGINNSIINTNDSSSEEDSTLPYWVKL